MFRHVPNALTAGRLLLAIVFFCMLSWYQYEGRGDPWFLNTAFFIYLVALITDFLDGYLARKWKVEGAFGRIVDPFVDKILVLGSFIFFAGKNFIIPDSTPHGSFVTPDPRFVVHTLTGVAPGIVVILLARELLVTSLRGMSESAGQNFGAAFSGKLKMVLQSATILVILAYVNYGVHWEPANEWWAARVRDGFIWMTVAITVFSGLIYIQRAMAIYKAGAIYKTSIPAP
jgi:CDP-diacylglycerol--glycerol-3-phosphate 3-phosphatidyltransferase